MIRNGFIVSAVACASIAAAALGARAAGPSDGWQQVGTGIQGGVSGMALTEGAPVGPNRADAVIVRDNKGDGESRVATVRLRPGRAPVTTELLWLGVLPKDLEALDAVPGRAGHYIALASNGDAYHILVANGRATVQGGPVTVPERRDGDNYESFALHRDRSGRVFAVWATRGSGALKAVVRAASARVGTYGLDFGSPTARQEFAVPFPNEDEVRHISDLKVLADGSVLVSSASDPNVDDGPFSSAVYNAGRLTVDGAHHAVLRLRKTDELTPLRRFTKQDDRKIEAIAFPRDGRAIWGTDDENHGGWVRFDRVTP
ncbi:hypothetical protein [Streptomyces sp. BE133]|uniref:hypothetical protein n=1 Tax=Streptomyces sp. BE133 TaxID=3002523 RepID=UPI002E78E315|nr:hypothetical protein [Streptomyces sp. BE133]MEE1807749.1 hypothetical protein [Streptomyces sp. BE133]